jgi:hypothetical protein
MEMATEIFPFPHDELVAGVRSERFRVAIRQRPRDLAKLLPPASLLAHLALTNSALLLAAVFVFFAFRTSNYWYLLAIPCGYWDAQTSSGRLTLFDFLLWLPLLVVGGILTIWWPMASACLWMAGGFTVTRFLASMRLGITHSEVLGHLTRSEETFVWAYQKGMITVYDTSDSWKRYGSAKP